MKTIDPKAVSTAALHGYMLGAVTPRPIAFASTIDSAGNVNLSIAKHRNGAKGKVELVLIGHLTKFKEFKQQIND